MRRSLPEESNFLGLGPQDSNPESAGAIIIPVPFEQTSSFGQGSDAGPAAIIRASHEVELFDAVPGFETFTKLGGIATMEPLQCDTIIGLCAELEREAGFWMNRNRFVVTIGGEHTSIVGSVRAAARCFDDLTILQLDAHSDLRQEYQDNPWSHACAVRRILDFHSSLVQVAIRSQTRDEREFSESAGLPVFFAHRIHADESDRIDWPGAVIEHCKQNVYLTFDCDSFDPSVIPSTGTPEPGGLSWYQVDSLLERLTRERRLVGFDVSELAPVDGLHHPQFTIAKLIYRILGYVSRTR